MHLFVMSMQALLLALVLVGRSVAGEAWFSLSCN
jgi:hypothetical protein